MLSIIIIGILAYVLYLDYKKENMIYVLGTEIGVLNASKKTLEKDIDILKGLYHHVNGKIEKEIEMPSKSKPQAKLMAAAAHTKGGYGGVSQKVGKEFNKADKGTSILKGKKTKPKSKKK